nr:hypothetical protein [uncultured Psychroserpens sp.]
MLLKDFNLSSYGSNIKFEVKIDDSDRVLLVNVQGDYRKGSQGNNDADLIYGFVSSYFLIIEPDVVIVNLSNLNYTWGNSIMKVLNLMKNIGRDKYERNLDLLIILSKKNKKYIASLLQTEESLLPKNFYDNLEDGIIKAGEIIGTGSR